MRRIDVLFACLGSVLFVCGPIRGENAAPEGVDPALRALQDFVGHWKGVGQVRRGSTQGSWIEKADWRWDFAGGKSSILFTTPGGKHFASGRITPRGGAKPGANEPAFTLAAATPEGTKLEYAGTLNPTDETLTFTCDDAPAGAPQRVTIRFTAEKMRLIALLERKLEGSNAYARLGEIGYTREGSDFGKGASGGPVCIVTGGAGTIAVRHDGKTYYVCCTGCQDLFNSDPAKFVAEYQAKLKAKK